MGLKGNPLDWRALVLEMREDGLSKENCKQMMATFEEHDQTPRKAVQIYRKAMERYAKEEIHKKKKAVSEAAIPRPDAFGNWS